MEKLKAFIKKHLVSIIIIASLLFISSVGVIIYLLNREKGDMVVVTVDGVTVGEYYLSEDGTYSLNGGTNVLTIEDGVAYMSYSDCDGHDCEKQGKAKFVGQKIICLPNKIIVTVVAGEGSSGSDDAVDLVS